jgi:hypothetical protein
MNDSQPHPSPTSAKSELDLALEHCRRYLNIDSPVYENSFGFLVKAAKRTSEVESILLAIRVAGQFGDGPIVLQMMQRLEAREKDIESYNTIQSKLATAEREKDELKSQVEVLTTAFPTNANLLKRLNEAISREMVKEKQLSSQSADVKLMVEALQRVWDEDECGWIVGNDDRRECVKCGAADLRGNIVVHTDGCTQGFIAEALATETAKKFQA